MLQRARDAYAQLSGRSAPMYGVAAGIAIALPLLVGTLAGYGAQASMVALGAYLVALRTPEGPYGARARDLAVGVLVVAVGSGVGGLLSERTWLPVLVVPPLIALGIAVPRIGATAGLAVLLSAVRPPSDVLLIGILELLGGLLLAAMLLAPWPARRLRPLQAALSEAADAVAEALDAVAQDVPAPGGSPLDDVDLAGSDLLEEAVRIPDWEAKRRAASEALTEARATYGLYRSGRGRSEPTRPERLIEALGRVLHETVTLQAVLEAAKNYPPDREWREETQTAISALAARLRLLSGALGSGGQAPLGREESAAVRRLGRAAEYIRRAGLTGDEDLVAVSLVGQVRRSVDRIAGEVASTRRIVAGGLRFGIGPPRMPETLDPAPVWDKVRRAVRNRSPLVRQVARVYVTALLTMALVAALDLGYGHWMTITAMLSLRATYGETVEHLLQRMGGTAAGCVIAAVILTLAPGPATMAFIVFCSALAGYALRSINQMYWQLFGTPVAMMLLFYTAPADWVTAGQRVLLTFGGTVIAYLAVRLLWPAGHLERLPVRLRRLLDRHAGLVRSTADVLAGERLRLAHDTIVAAERSAEAIGEARTRLGHERLPDSRLMADLETAVDAAHRTRDHLITIAKLSREPAVDTGPMPEILDRLADQLEEAAERVEEPDDRDPAATPAEELSEELAGLDAHLSTLTKRRRAEITSGIGRDEEFTPLRHALLQVSGTRDTVRALGEDTGRVIDASLSAAERRP